MWPVDFAGQPSKDTSFRKTKYPPLPLYEGKTVVKYIQTLDDQAQLTSLYTQKAVQFIARNKQKPFFLYLAHSMVHVPLGASPKFKGKSGAGLFGDVMEEVDWSVGEVIKALKTNGLTENTLVIFSSDNGPWLNCGNHAGSTGGQPLSQVLLSRFKHPSRPENGQRQFHSDQISAGQQLVHQLVRRKHQRDCFLSAGQCRQIGACFPQTDATLQEKRRVRLL